MKTNQTNNLNLMVRPKVSPKYPIEAGKSYFELIPLVKGIYRLRVTNYSNVVLTREVASEAEGKDIVAFTFPNGI